jgi:hypothetical protein
MNCPLMNQVFNLILIFRIAENLLYTENPYSYITVYLVRLWQAQNVGELKFFSFST